MGGVGNDAAEEYWFWDFNPDVAACAGAFWGHVALVKVGTVQL